PFTFRLWINDVKPPTVTLKTTAANRSGRLILAVSDVGSGVDPSSISARVDGGAKTPVSYSPGRVVVQLGSLSSGKHTLELTVSDYQETKNMEAFGNPLPNTRAYRAGFTIR